jgi:hypothetical protein
MLEQRLDEELSLIRTRYPGAERIGRWFRIPKYVLGDGWEPAASDLLLVAKPAHPGDAPYGIYAPLGITFKGSPPANFSPGVPEQPPFPGAWGVFSWEPAEREWRPTADITKGANLLNFVIGFATRFREGA